MADLAQEMKRTLYRDNQAEEMHALLRAREIEQRGAATQIGSAMYRGPAFTDSPEGKLLTVTLLLMAACALAWCYANGYLDDAGQHRVAEAGSEVIR